MRLCSFNAKEVVIETRILHSFVPSFLSLSLPFSSSMSTFFSFNISYAKSSFLIYFSNSLFFLLFFFLSMQSFLSFSLSLSTPILFSLLLSIMPLTLCKFITLLLLLSSSTILFHALPLHANPNDSSFSLNRKLKLDFTIFLHHLHQRHDRHRHHRHHHTNSPPAAAEIDPRYGVEKRLVPTGPNPLHH